MLRGKVSGKVSNSTSAVKPCGPPTMAVLALLVGLVAGYGAILFRGMISLVYNLLFHGAWSFHYNANIHAAISPWGAGVILVPVIGAVLVVFLVKTFAPEAKGHGVPEVMDAVYYQDGRIRPIVAAVKSLASAISIGSGGAVGREGPIIQIGSAFGSTLGQIIPMPVSQRVTLVAAGAAGGIAATFNTPIGGVVFAVELLLPAVNAMTLMPVAMSTVTAAFIGRYYLGLQPALSTPELILPRFYLENPEVFPAFIVFGLLVGLLAALFVKSIYWFEDWFDKLPGTYYTRHCLGMLCVGVLIYLFMAGTGHYYIQGVGYASIEDILHGKLTSPEFLLLLIGAKLLATCLTLGSGASGGIFSPCLFLGATVGGAFGFFVNQLFPGLGASPIDFAVVGMAGMIAGTTGALITAITMLFEMTRDYNVILPLILTVSVAYMVRKYVSPASIYTLKLLRRGHIVPEGLQAAHEAAHRASDIMSAQFLVMPADATLDQWPVDVGATNEGPVIVVEENDNVVGVLDSKPILIGQNPETINIGELAHANFVFVGENRNFLEVLAINQTQQVEVTLVAREHSSKKATDVIGVITHNEIARTIRSTAKLFG